MKVDVALSFEGQVDQFIEDCGNADSLFDGIMVGESKRNPFLPLMMAAEHTQRVRLETSVAIAFARNPMLLAQEAYDLHQYSRGRFTLGLGTQVKPHIENRFSMPWSAPAPRMREMVYAIRAIWECWHHGTKLDFRGEFYTHTLMIPFFNPGENPYGLPRIALAAVGARMTEVAGEVSDELLLHPLMTERYLRSVTLPALQRGLDKVGRGRDDFEISASVFIVTGLEERARQVSEDFARERIAFYGSTPAYRPVFDLHGWSDAHLELNRLSKQGCWDDMKHVVDDEMLNAFAVVAEPANVASTLFDRFGAFYDRVNYYAADLEFAATVTPELQSYRRL